MQDHVSKFWDSKPCDSESSDGLPGTQLYYREIEEHRYAHQKHIALIIDKLPLKGNEVLEIGTGVGTDARRLICRGAIYNGINVDKGSCEATRQALRAFGLKGDVTVMSATDMRFPDGSFDLVYTFGVLHHIPEISKAIDEIYRVLRPGGILLAMVYNRSSINYMVEIRVLRKLMLRILLVPGTISVLSALGFPSGKLRRHVELFKSFRKMTDEEWLSRNTDGPDNPYSTVYGADEIDRLLGRRFRISRNEVYFFDQRHWGIVGRLMPRQFVDLLGRRWGWHRVVVAERI